MYTHSRTTTHADTQKYIYTNVCLRVFFKPLCIYSEREEENIYFVLLVLISWYSWIHLNLCLKKVKERNINDSHNNHKSNTETIKDNVNSLNFTSTFTQLFRHWTKVKRWTILVNVKKGIFLRQSVQLFIICISC